jgi:hypothetical protein
VTASADAREDDRPPAACEPTGRHRFSCGLEFRVDGAGRVTGLSFALFEFARGPSGGVDQGGARRYRSSAMSWPRVCAWFSACTRESGLIS